MGMPHSAATRTDISGLPLSLILLPWAWLHCPGPALPAHCRPLPQLLLTLTFTGGASADSFCVLLPAFFVGLLILGVDEVARWVLLPRGN